MFLDAVLLTKENQSIYTTIASEKLRSSASKLPSPLFKFPPFRSHIDALLDRSCVQSYLLEYRQYTYYEEAHRLTKRETVAADASISPPMPADGRHNREGRNKGRRAVQGLPEKGSYSLKVC